MRFLFQAAQEVLLPPPVVRRRRRRSAADGSGDYGRGMRRRRGDDSRPSICSPLLMIRSNLLLTRPLRGHGRFDTFTDADESAA